MRAVPVSSGIRTGVYIHGLEDITMRMRGRTESGCNADGKVYMHHLVHVENCDGKDCQVDHVLRSWIPPLKPGMNRLGWNIEVLHSQTSGFLSVVDIER